MGCGGMNTSRINEFELTVDHATCLTVWALVPTDNTRSADLYFFLSHEDSVVPNRLLPSTTPNSCDDELDVVERLTQQLEH